MTNSNQNSGRSGEGQRGGGRRGWLGRRGRSPAGVGGGLSCPPWLEPSSPETRSWRGGWGARSCRGVGKALGLGCVQRTVLCKAFPCRERVCSVRGPALRWRARRPLQCQGLGRRGRSPLASLATRDTWGLSRADCAACVGGEPSGQMGHLTALAGPQHHVGTALAPLHVVATENCVPCVCAFHRAWLPPRRR